MFDQQSRCIEIMLRMFVMLSKAVFLFYPHRYDMVNIVWSFFKMTRNIAYLFVQRVRWFFLL